MKPSHPAQSTYTRAWLPTLCAIVFLTGVAAAPAQSLKVGVVDINKVFSSYYKTRDIDKQLAEARAGATKDLDERLAHHKQMLDDISALGKAIENADLSPEIKTEQLKKREDKIRELRQFEQATNEFRNGREKDMKDSATRYRSQIIEDIMVVIDAKVKSEKYDLVFNRSGQGRGGLPVVVTSNDKLDFTDGVIAALNKDHPTPPPDPSPTAAPAGSPKK